MNYTVTYSRRKTIGICITRDAVLEVRAPRGTSRDEIEGVLLSKKDWIEKHLTAMQKRVASQKAFTLDYGQMALMEGVEYPILPREGNRAWFDGSCFYLPPGLEPEQLRQGMMEIYRRAAKARITERVARLLIPMGVAPSAVKINGAKTRWGSCSSGGSLNFSWRLIMAPGDVIDYVVIHELAHLREMNHSPRFWAIVEQRVPDYRQRKKQLADLQKRLAAENWNA